MPIQKPIRLSQHAQEQIIRRGAAEEEIYQAIKTSSWEKAELGRLQCRKDFVFDRVWNNKQYACKQVRPIFVEEQSEIVVVTVYVYYA